MKKVPVIADPERYEAAAFEDSEFVVLSTNEWCDVQMQYPLLGMQHGETVCYVRKEVYGRLVQAAKSLPEGYRLRLLDAWRPFALQKELYEVYSQDIIRDFRLEQCSEEERKAMIRKYVSDPIPDREIPPVHTTGGAVDLTVLDETGTELPMGTAFDAFTDSTYTAYYEDPSHCVTEADVRIQKNRRLLYHIMTSAGFTNLPSEWWHYDYGDRFWGYYKGSPAIYRGVFTREEIHGTE